MGEVLIDTNNVICGDALEVVHTLGVFNYCITDPPYPTGGQSSMSSLSSVKDARDMVDAMAQSLIAGVLRNIQKSPQFTFWIMCDWRQISFLSSILRKMGYPRQNCIVWDKVKSGFSGRYHPQHEMILYASNHSPEIGYMGTDLIRVPSISGDNKHHAFDKPPELVEKFAHNFPHGRVIDPFCGGGGLLVGSKRLGLDVAGVDISQECVDITNRRLASDEICNEQLSLMCGAEVR